MCKSYRCGIDVTCSPQHSSPGSASPGRPGQERQDSPRDSPASLSQQTLKQRVNMVVMRMIAQNSDQDQRSLSGQGGVGGGQQQLGHAPGHAPNHAPSPQHYRQDQQESRETLKYKVLQVSAAI